MQVTDDMDQRAGESETADCPAWCRREHLGDEAAEEGFHHDGPVTIVAVEHPVTERRGYDLFVNVSQHVQLGASDERPYVEVEDGLQTLVLLTPVECLALSRALLNAAASLEDEDQLEHIRRKRLVEEIEVLLNRGRSPQVGGPANEREEGEG